MSIGKQSSIHMGCFITGCNITIGDNTVIRNSEVEYSIILRDCKVLNVKIRIEGSILGNDVEIVEASGKPHVHRFMIGDQSRVEVA